MSSVVTSESVQTSPDSTSHETDMDGGERGGADTSLTSSSDTSASSGVPDSQMDTSSASSGGTKRGQENTVNGHGDGGVKRIKSDSES